MTPTDEEVERAIEVLRRYHEQRRELFVASREFYSTKNLPPACSRDTFHARCRHISTARKNGRTWIVPAADFLAALPPGGRRQEAVTTNAAPTPPTKAPRARTAPIADRRGDDSVEALLARRGAALGVRT